jgi:predicted DsbA family dithiol-disulfide isomerase
MKVDIWSDVRCPFCYIGKRKFEMALERFPNKDNVEVIWHSFQLDPSLQTRPDVNVLDYLARIKGITREQAAEMHEHVTEVAGEVGLSFDFDRSVLANSLKAHRLIQLAKTKGLGDRAEEELFKAHFTAGKNIDDDQTLAEIGELTGIPASETAMLIASDAYLDEVEQDESHARSIGIRGVPFFIFDDKYAVSGAQSPEFFLQTLQKTWEESAHTPV